MSWQILLVWVLFIGSLVFLTYYYMKIINKNKENRKERQKAYEEKREKYTY